MIHRIGPLPGSEIARRSGLSPQTVSVILRELEAEGLMARGEPQRGKVGKPSVPMGISPDGAFAVGLKLGRRSSDLFLVDLMGDVRYEDRITYRYPTPTDILNFLDDGLAEINRILGPVGKKRICGIGIATPFEIWKWPEIVGAPPEAMAGWETLDLVAEIGRFSDLPVLLENDATAACRAEHVFGRGREFRDFAYFFVASFIGGGIVLNHSIFEGPHANAGAFGSLPVSGPSGEPLQLIDVASLHLLDSKLVKAGVDPQNLWQPGAMWDAYESHVDEWVNETAPYLARAALTVCAVVDFEAVLIDGAFPPSVREKLVARTRHEMERLDSRGLFPPAIEEGIVGANARAPGAASFPIFSRYLLNTHGMLSIA